MTGISNDDAKRLGIAKTPNLCFIRSHGRYEALIADCNLPLLKIVLEEGDIGVNDLYMDKVLGYRTTLLSRAIINDQPQIVAYLRSVGASFEVVDEKGRTPVGEALESTNPAYLMLPYLKDIIESGDIGVNDLYGDRTLGYKIPFLSRAIMNDQPQTVAYLRSIGASFEVVDEKGRTPVDEAAASGKPAYLWDYLENGAVRPKDIVGTPTFGKDGPKAG